METRLKEQLSPTTQKAGWEFVGVLFEIKQYYLSDVEFIDRFT